MAAWPKKQVSIPENHQYKFLKKIPSQALTYKLYPMKTKNLLRVLSLSTNIYLIAQDKELMEKLTRMAKAGKEKYDEIFHSDDASEEDSDEETLMTQLAQVAGEVREKLNQEIEAIVHKTYEKLRIAHADDVAELREEIAALKAKIDN